ncbi:MAG TPA: isopentenyl-diphosphate Delta-isomerase [Flavobacteriales bacterium]|nr:isopentenyl-diphosphate Delta-isomerase [Flavobacteriales bacterium]
MNHAQEFVILVDANDVQTGVAEKMEAHQKALLHRAFSVFIFNLKGEMLIHQRAMEKYHSGGKWTNACCGHPRPNETTAEAASRRLKEEMGFTCMLDEKFSFTYKAELDHQLSEHEIDHVFFGQFEGDPLPDSNEVMSYKWVSIATLKQDVELNPGSYTTWFKICLDEVLSKI